MAGWYEERMLREVAQFLRHGPEIARLQKKLTRSELLDVLSARSDAAGFGAHRRSLVADLAGKRVLEIGCGTGGMFRYYPRGTQVEAIEPEADFLESAMARAPAAPAQVHVTHGDGTRLAFPDATFDAVVLGLVLCSVPSVEQVLAEAH